jgi:hypothetical protein
MPARARPNRVALGGVEAGTSICVSEIERGSDWSLCGPVFAGQTTSIGRLSPALVNMVLCPDRLP